MKQHSFRKILVTALAVFMILGNLGIEARAAETDSQTATESVVFAPRLEAPAMDNKYYYDGEYNLFEKFGFGMPNCTAYAYGRAYEILVTAYGEKVGAPKLSRYNACTFYTYNIENNCYEYGSTPRLGAIACWSGHGAGHVAVVEQINDDGTILISEASSSKKVHYRTKTIKGDGSDYASGYSFQGYVYLLPEQVTVTDPIGDPETDDDYSGYDPEDDLAIVSVSYRTHVQSKGWLDFVEDGEMAGTTGEKKRLEGIEIKVSGNDKVGIRYTTHVQTYGWQPWSMDGEMSGTEGEAKRLEAIRIELTGEDKDLYDVCYRVHAETFGWMGWVKNGEPAGTAGYAKRLEGIEILVIKKGKTPPERSNQMTEEGYRTTETDTDVYQAGVNYKTHVQTYGWKPWSGNGIKSGTEGEAKRMEAVSIKLMNQPVSGSVEYLSHVQTYGWETEWNEDGAISGTEGEAKRLEAIRIRLTGEMEENYDIYYRVHVQSFGWMDWAANGEPAGSAGYAKRLEAIEIVLVEKGSPAPGNTSVPFKDATEE